MQFLVTGIEWDTDGEDVDLPTELTVDAEAHGIKDPDTELADWLSDRYGWAVVALSHEPAANSAMPGPSAR